MSSSWLAALRRRFGTFSLLAQSLTGSMAACGILAATAAPVTAAETWPHAVTAVYKITFNGFDLGTFRFRARVDGKSYALDGQGEISALLGAFSWRGLSRSSGTVAGDQPQPAGYTFEYSSSSKSGSIKMGFREADVASLSVLPAATEDEDLVPVRAHHLKSVLDPLSAVMRLTRADAGPPCGKRLSIFDGKQRFDLQLSYGGLQRISETRPSGLPSDAVVCRVRYMPIAGHKRDVDKEAAGRLGIEVTLRPVPSANLLVPTRIVVPTVAGSAVLTSERIDIETTGSGAIALVY